MCPERACGRSRCGEGALGSFGGWQTSLGVLSFESLSLGLSGFTHGRVLRMLRAFLPGAELVYVSSAALSQFGAGVLWGDPLPVSQNLFVALVRLIVVSVIFIILMSKTPQS